MCQNYVMSSDGMYADCCPAKRRRAASVLLTHLNQFHSGTVKIYFCPICKRVPSYLQKISFYLLRYETKKYINRAPY